MSKSVQRISPDKSLAAAAQIMSANNISCIIVIDNNKLVGILTETDFLKKVADKNKNFETIFVDEIMTSPVITIPASLSLIDAGRMMLEKRIKRLPVIQDKRLVGIVTQTDMTRAFTSTDICDDVVEIMSQNVAAINIGSMVVEAVEVMVAKNITSIVIMEGEKVVGIFTERDLCRKIIAPRNEPTNLKIEKVMSRPVMSIPYHYSLSDASRIMEKMHIRRLVVMKENKLCGILTQSDIFRAMQEHLDKEEKKLHPA
ncbi:MAG: cyclic nucleotide-binding/CBS domain-containing protein [bacterium]